MDPACPDGRRGVQRVLPRRGWRLALALLIVVPATALALGSHLGDRRAGWHQPWMRPALVELRTGLPRDALLVVPPGDLDTPVFLARDAFDMDKVDGAVRGYDPVELARRHALVDTLYRAGRVESRAGPCPGTHGAAGLRGLARPGKPWQARTPGVPLRNPRVSRTFSLAERSRSKSEQKACLPAKLEVLGTA